jgi:asparagine synthase (glutamine-hydrolysing)
MCGISGLLAATSEQSQTVRDVERMVGSMVHRGPDDSGVLAGDRWAMGMRRLAIQDVSSAGHQPMSVRDLTLVFNGEIYNFHQLRVELEHVGYDFRSGSDTEVVLYALEHWGLSALSRFNGMFALALVDDRRRTALLARDRFGKKPLFIARLQRGVAFASELKGIAEIARGELTIDRDAMGEFFRLQYVPTPMSIFRQVRKLPAASWTQVDLDSGACSTPEEFWALPEASPPRAPATAQEIFATVRSSVERRLVADVPVGAFLSGGTDSSLVVACMRDLGVQAQTFSIGFADSRFDESRYALAVADRLQTDHTHLRLEPSEAISLVPQLAHSYDEPFADSSAIPMLAVSRLAREGVKVVLSGDGGDELFAGYLRYRRAPALRLAAKVPRGVGGLIAQNARRGMFGRRGSHVAALFDASNAAEAYREVVSIWRSHDLALLMPDIAPGRGFEEAGAWTNGCGPVERMMRCDARTYLIDDILQKVDRATMSVGLEARNPLLDPEVVSIALASIRPAERAPGQKQLLRAALRLRLPEHLVNRPKMGFGVPVADWMRAELRPLVEDLVLARQDAEYDVGVAHSLCREHLNGEREAGAQLWSLLAFELWRERWLSTKPGAS